MPSDLNLRLRLTADGRGFVAAIKGGEDALDDLRDSVGKTGRETEKTERKARGLGAAFRRMSGELKTGIASFVAGGAILGTVQTLLSGFTRSLQNAARFVVDSGLRFETWNQRLLAAAGTAEGAADAMTFLRRETGRLGLDLGASAHAFSGFAAAARGTALQGEAARKIFSGVGEVVAVMGLSAADTQAVFLALEQIVSKGTVAAEELRGQLGERLPGAFEAAARALGVTTSELDGMLRRGEVLAEDLLPRLAAELSETFGDALPDATASARSEFARLRNALLDLGNAAAESGLLDWLGRVAAGATAALEALTPADGTPAAQVARYEAQLRERLLRNEAIAASPAPLLTSRGTRGGATDAQREAALHTAEALRGALEAPLDALIASTGRLLEEAREDLRTASGHRRRNLRAEIVALNENLAALVEYRDRRDAEARAGFEAAIESQRTRAGAANASFDAGSAEFDAFAAQRREAQRREFLRGPGGALAGLPLSYGSEIARGDRPAIEAATAGFGRDVIAELSDFSEPAAAAAAARAADEAARRREEEIEAQRRQREQLIAIDLRYASRIGRIQLGVLEFERSTGRARLQSGLEIARTSLSQLGGHNRTAFRLAQAAGIAQAVISMHAGIAEALKKGFPAAAIEGALVAAAGAAQIAAIRAQRPPQAFQRGGIVDRPTFFTSRDVPFGVAGEAGPEAIVPLRRGPDGTLGLGAPRGRTVVNFAPRVEIRVEAGADPDAAEAAARRAAGALRQEFRSFVDDEMRPGGRFHRLNVA